MANSNANIKYLSEYLNQQLDSTFDEITEIISENEDSYKELEKYQTLKFRKVWIQTQLQNIYFTQA